MSFATRTPDNATRMTALSGPPNYVEGRRVHLRRVHDVLGIVLSIRSAWRPVSIYAWNDFLIAFVR
jgi:hypothetical protein